MIALTRHSSHRARLRAAFSWLDIIVAIAVILLLIAILLPSLQDARRQARVAKCLSNLRLLNVTALQYCLDFDDRLPLTWRPAGQPARAFSFAYGGKANDDWWRTAAGGAGCIPSDERPLNRYLSANTALSDRARSKPAGNAEFAVLDCPADHQSYARGEVQPIDGPLRLACFDDIGTSYHFNLHALTDTNIDVREDGANWPGLCQAMFREVLARHSATFLAFLPDPLNYALGQHVKVTGNHGQPGRHELSFLDGHAEYRTIDTTSWRGENWTALVPEWTDEAGFGRTGIHYTAPDKARAPAGP